MLQADTPYRSISEVQRAYSDGKTTVKQVVQQYLTSIECFNQELNAITVLNEHALEDAEKLDVSRRDRDEETRLTYSMRAWKSTSEVPCSVFRW